MSRYFAFGERGSPGASFVVDIDYLPDLVFAMRYKAANIRAHMPPEIFEAVAAALEKYAKAEVRDFFQFDGEVIK